MRSPLELLLRLDLLRMRAAAGRPVPGAIAGIIVPLALTASLLWAIGRAGRPSVGGAEDAVLLAMLIAGPVSYLAYGTLFRGGDAALLRRLGVPARAIYAERAIRHLAQAVGLAMLGLIPFLAAGETLARPVAAAIAGMMAAWGAGSAVTARAGLAMARHRPGQGWGCLMAGIWDRDVAAAAPLAYAPVPGFAAGIVAGGLAGHDARWLFAVVPFSMLSAAAGAAWYERALPRFGAQALEMAFSPSADARGGELRVGRGIARVLPRTIRTVQARDSVVVARRFPWATRIAWPVAIGGALALARWGDDPVTRAWVAGAVCLVLLVQALAGVGLGRAEAGRSRWIDRSLGIGPASRLAGRWVWGWGLSLWTTLPIALAWTWWSGEAHGWAWLLTGGGVAGVAAVASALASSWR